MSLKRKADREFDVRQFLSLEAEVDGERSESDEEANDIEDFLDFEPLVGDRQSTQAYLYREYERAEEEHGEWQEFIQRATMRASEGSNSGRTTETPEGNTSKYGVPQKAPDQDDAFLYKVPVKPGYEEAYAFAILEKIVKADANAYTAIRSVIGRTSLPGLILVEALDVKLIYEICRGMTHVRLNGVCCLPFADAISCLRERQTFTPHSPGWVRMKSGRYRGDTAYVANVNPQTLMPTLWLIPRLPTFPHDPSSQKKKREARPERALFDPLVIRHRFGTEHIKEYEQGYVFRGQTYSDRFQILRTENYVPEDSLPTREELAFFRCHPKIPRAVLQAAYDAIDASCLRHGDRVLIARGEYQGCAGTIKSISQSAAEVQIPLNNTTVTISCNDLRKDIRVGDEVKVICGPNTGFVGWVVATGENGTVDLYSRDEDKEVKEQNVNIGFESPKFMYLSRNFFQVGDEIKVVGGSLEGIRGVVISVDEDDGKLTIKRSDQEPVVKVLAKDAQKASALGRGWQSLEPHDPFRQYIGSHVVVTASEFKQYRGRIRETQNGGYVSVELEATLQRIRIHISKLALWTYGKYIRFSDLEYNIPQEATHRIPVFGPTPYASESTSSQLYSPAWNSSQTPEASTSSLPSAWDPSSRTPIPLSSEPLTRAMPLPSSWSQPIIKPPPPPSQAPWFTDPKLSGRRLFVKPKDTNPVLRDPGFKHGNYEGMNGILTPSDTTVDNYGAEVHFGFEKIRIPARYIVPVYPTMKGLNVVVISGEKIGNEYTVVEFGPLQCSLKPRGKRGKKIETVLTTNTLCTYN